MRQGNGRRRYFVTTSLIGWAVVVVGLHMPGLARWLMWGLHYLLLLSICLFIYLYIYLFIFSSSASSFFFFLPLLLLPACSSSWGRLPFWAGDVDCLFGQEVDCLSGRIFPRGGDIACMCEGCSGGVFVICHWPNQGRESTHRLHLYPLGGVFFRQPDRCSDSEPGTQLGPPIHVLALLDDRLTSLKRPCS